MTVYFTVLQKGIQTEKGIKTIFIDNNLSRKLKKDDLNLTNSLFIRYEVDFINLMISSLTDSCLIFVIRNYISLS